MNLLVLLTYLAGWIAPEFAIAPVYDEAMEFSEGLANVTKDGKAGYIDQTGRTVIPFTYAEASQFHEGVAFVRVRAGGNWQAIDKAGKLLMEDEFENRPDFADGLACVLGNRNHSRGANGYINKAGAVVIPYRYAGAYPFSEGLAAVELNGRWGYIDKTGKLVIPATLRSVFAFREGLAACEKADQGGNFGASHRGYIDKRGRFVVPAQFQDAAPFSDGLAYVEKGNLRGFIDKTGKLVLQAGPGVKYARSFSEGLLAFEKNNKHGFIDKTGKTVIEPQYDWVQSFSEGLALVGNTTADHQTSLIDKTGKVVLSLPRLPGAFDASENAFGSREGLLAVRSADSGKFGFVRNPLYQK